MTPEPPLPEVFAAPAAPALPPPAGLPGLDPAWSRLVVARDAEGLHRTWHLLDTGADPDDRLTLLCVHGNPTWSYLWRRLLAGAPAGVRVIAVDQLDMGFSERTGRPRRLADRIDDLAGLVDELDITTPIVTVAHDWGGPVSLGWAVRNPDRLAGVVLTNTAVHQPAGSPAPTLIRLARSGPVLATMTVRTDGFVRGTTTLSRLSGHPMPAEVAAAFRAPYATPARRAAIGTFVVDIPLEADHPSMPALEEVATGLARLRDVPVLMLWGPDDPVFSDRYLRDLQQRLPQADVHRYERARHLVLEDAPTAAGDLLRWIARLPVLSTPPADPTPSPPLGSPVDLAPPPTGAPAGPALPPPVGSPVRVAPPPPSRTEPDRRIWAGLLDRAGEGGVAVAEPRPDGTWRRVPWSLLARRVEELGAGLAAAGVRPGDRVALLVRPGADLIALVYACWRVGAVVVVADAGLGVAGMRRALRGAGPDHVVAIPPGLALARTLAVPGLRIAVGASRGQARALGVTIGPDGPVTLAAVALMGAGRDLPDPPAPDDDAVVVFTSGATGPAKGVVYRHRQLQAQRDALRSLYAITGTDALVAAFAPWAVLGPALGIPSAIPEMDVTAAGTLTAGALADATAAVGGTLLWASPAALANVVATAGDLTVAQRDALDGLRVVMSAGAPVPASLLRAAADLAPRAQARTPYGMTEALPVADVTLEEIEAAGPGNGVLVGRPVPGASIRIAALHGSGAPTGELTDAPRVTGEIVVAAPWLKDRYDRLWATQERSSRDAIASGSGRTAAFAAGSGRTSVHRTGDVGHLDTDGRLWVEGRLVHVIVTDVGPVTPVGIEQRVERLPGVRTAAAVGVGPAGTQRVVVVVVPDEPATRPEPASRELATAVRAVAGCDVAAVLCVPAVPVDIRHNSKIDRVALADWAARTLAGARLRNP